MKISELVAALQKIGQLIGDVPVVLRHLETAAETEIRSLGVSLDPVAETAASAVTLAHTEATPPPVVVAEPPAKSTA